MRYPVHGLFYNLQYCLLPYYCALFCWLKVIYCLCEFFWQIYIEFHRINKSHFPVLSVRYLHDELSARSDSLWSLLGGCEKKLFCLRFIAL